MKRPASAAVVVLAAVLLLLSFKPIEEAVLRNYAAVRYIRSKLDEHRPVSVAGDWAASRLIGLKTRNIATLQIQGILLAEVDNAKAVQAFSQVVAQKPGDQTARYYLAQIYERQGDLEQALAQLSFVGVGCDDPHSLNDQDVLRLCIERVENDANAGQPVKALRDLEPILTVYPELLWGKWRAVQFHGETHPCLKDVMPARLDPITDRTIQRLNAEALLHLAACPSGAASDRLQAARYVDWLGMDERLGTLLSPEEAEKVKAQLAQDPRAGTQGAPSGLDETRRLVARIFNTAPDRIALGEELVRGGDFEGELDSAAGWRHTYQVGQPENGEAVYAVGKETRAPLSGSQSVRIAGLYPPRSGDTRAGVWAETTTELGPGCYIFQVAYRTTSDVGQEQVWVWSAGSEAPMSMKLWGSYHALPPTSGEINQAAIIGCLASENLAGVDVSRFVDKKNWRDVPVVNSVYCSLHSLSEAAEAGALGLESGGSVLSTLRTTVSTCLRNGSFRGLFKPYLSLSGAGVAWFDDLSLRQIYSPDFPPALVEQPAFLINGAPVEP
jgi:tetratricopeptide (TPR) repeat protein